MGAVRTVRRRASATAAVGLLAVALSSCWGSDDSSVVSRDGAWKTVDYHGTRAEIPSDWTRADTGDCEFSFERWTPPDVEPCAGDGGLAFYYSATFDPAYGPGVRHRDPGADAPAWGGWVDGGDWDVYVADDDHDVVQHVLASVEAPD